MNKLSKVLVLSILLLLAVGGFTACSSTEGNTTANNAKPTDNKNSTTVSDNKKPEDAKPASTEPKSDDVASTDDKIGVPECDEYIAKYEACVNDNVPENMRASLKTTFEQSRKAWKAAAANPQAKATLGSTCKQAMETARQAMASYKCDF